MLSEQGCRVITELGFSPNILRVEDSAPVSKQCIAEMCFAITVVFVCCEGAVDGLLVVLVKKQSSADYTARRTGGGGGRVMIFFNCR